jgi:23S rRNA (guanosine2251-2'-O)-methyltransferase
LAAATNSHRKIEDIWCSESVAPKLEEAQSKSGLLRRYCIADKRTLDGLVHEQHQGIIVKAAPLPYDSIDALECQERAVVVVLDQVTDPQNVGSILRVCRVFGCGLIMTRAHAPPETGAIAKVASGALEFVPRYVVPNLATGMRQLKSFGFWCVGLSEHASQSIRNVGFAPKTAIVMGSEGAGIRRLTRDLCDFFAFIPTAPEFSTLNVTTATAIALYEASSRVMHKDNISCVDPVVVGH